jgi:hypothetical protein
MKKGIFLLLFQLVLFSAFSQQSMTMYNMRSVYQRSYVNPGLLPDAKIYIGIPALGSNYLNVSNSRLDIKGLKGIFEDQGNDSFFINVSKLANLFEKRNYVNIEFNMDIINLGFALGKNRFGYNTTLKTMSKFSYPGDLLKVMLEGNGGQNLDKTFDFGFGLDMQQYLEHGIWYGREHSEKLSFGGRLKYIQGISNVWLEKSDIAFRTNPDDFGLNVTTDIKLNMSSAMFNPGLIKEGKVDSTFNIGKALKAFKNSGLGIDFGAQYYVTKRMSVSASVVDLGFINWKSNATNYQSRFPKKTTSFNGVDFNDFFGDSANFEESIQNLADSLIDRLSLDKTNKAYRRSLYTQFYLGGNYHVTKSHNAGVLFYGNFHQKRIHPGLTLSWNSKLTKIFSISASYTMINNTFNNLGLGFTINGGPFQFHLISDNVINAFIPQKARMINFRWGMGFVIGRDKNEKK